MKVFIQRFVLLIILLSLSLVFQNCGAPFESLESLEVLESIESTKDTHPEWPQTQNEFQQTENNEVTNIPIPDRPTNDENQPTNPPVVVEEMMPPQQMETIDSVEPVMPEPPAQPVAEQEMMQEPVVEPTKPVTPTPQVEPQNQECSIADKVFLESDSGQIIIEAEETVMKGKWEKRSGVNGSTGSGIIVYRRSNSPNERKHSYDGESELVYNISVEEAGTYNFSYRGARYKGPFNYQVFGHHDNVNCPPSKNNCTHSDLNNDAFVSTSNGLTPTKLFAGVGQSTDTWKVANTFDRNHNKSRAQVNLKAGLNKIFIRGRSTFFAIDKIFIFKGNQPNVGSKQSQTDCL